jgi:hypothetical protein
MSITGSLTDLSLREIFQFLEQGHKTGLLTLCALPESQAPPSVHYVWVSQGHIVAATHQLNHQGLVSLIAQYPWVSDRVVTKLAQFRPPDKPLGLYLRSQGALQLEQLEHLFQVQIVQELCAVFQLKDADFKFDPDAPLPLQEMTGLSVPSLVLNGLLQKLIWLKRLFEVRTFQRTGGRRYNHSENFCNQLIRILDIAFFHSLNFSLFDTNTNLKKLSQALDWCDRPYDLPKSREARTLCGKEV